MAVTNRAAWTDAGLDLLRDGGQDALTIARLCQALGRTKGAFYHHFEDIGAYLDATLEAWETRNTGEPIAQASRGASMKARRRALDDAVRQLDARLDLAVRAWGLRDPRARAFVVRVDERRIGYLADLLRSPRSLTKRRLIARLEYAAFLGQQQLDPTFSGPESAPMKQLLDEALSHPEGL